MRLRTRLAPAALLLLVPLIGSTPATADTGRGAVSVRQSDRAVIGQYIVTLAPELSPDTVLQRFGLRPLFSYRNVLNGFAAVLGPAQLSAVRAFPGVESVEENGQVANDPLPADSRAVAVSWGQDRIDQRDLPLDGQYIAAGTGTGVTSYIVDTGIDSRHREFGGRVTLGLDAVGDGRQGQDCNGHGTHVAGTVGGATVGVAPSTSLVTVRVLDCRGEGTWAAILAGFDWIARNAQQPAVVNASLGGPSSDAVDQAVGALWDRGVLPVVAAGNDSKDACEVSPAGADRVVTVAASDATDRQTGFSNWGECVELYAPGTAIVSAALYGGYRRLDGTSMASPHVAGVAALYREKNPDASPLEIAAWLDEQSTDGVLSNLGPGSPDRLLYTAGL
ncbi:S8 family peptidase [Streptomyces sp. NPDC057136]|uniref:S8 family peptidase n=1 Tax=Streptomyces sp. NPDC057136 TaxID=3346029 RepID=UPI00362B91BA